MAREEVTHHTAPNSDQEDEGESMELGAQLPAELVVADSLPQVPSSEVDNSLEGRTDIATASSSLGATSVAPVSTVEIPAPCDRLEEMLPQISSSSAPIYPITESLTVDTGHQCCSPNTRRLGPSPISSALGSHGRRMSTIPLSSLCSEHPISHPASSQENTSPDNTLAYKRKSEMIEKELSSPGKRVRGMSDSHLNIQLHSSPSASHYGHFHVSPQTPSRRRSSCKVRPPRNMESWLQTFVLWDSTEKTYALNQLIDRCDTAHVRHIMAVIEPQFQRDFISLLPKELALYVLSFLNPKDLLRAGQTCQYWRMLAEDTLLWKQKCRESGADLGLIYKMQPTARASSPCGVSGEMTPTLEVTSADDTIDWKSMYLRTHTIEHHWRCGEVKPTKTLRGHDDHVITCLEFSGNRIVSGSDDNTLKVWDVETGECIKTLVGHTGGVWSSQMRDNIVISGSTDRTLRVWDTDTGHCLHTLHGHTSTVRCMHLHGDVVVSGSRDATLRMWNITTGQCIHVLVGHVAAVRCVQFDGHKVVSGAYDYTVRVWDPVTHACIHVLRGHTNRVYSLQFDGKHIVSGSLDTSIRVWDVDTGTCLHTLTGHQSLTSGMEIQDGLLVSGNADSTVKVWDIHTGTCLQTLTGAHKHQGAVTCLQFTRKFVITSSDDGTVKLWSLQTGEFIRNLVSLDSGGSGGVVWRVKADSTLLVCASGSRNGTEDTKLLVLDFGLKSCEKNFLTATSHVTQPLTANSSFSTS